MPAVVALPLKVVAVIDVLSNVTPVPEVYWVTLLVPVLTVLPVKYKVPAGTATISITPALTADVAVPAVVALPLNVVAVTEVLSNVTPVPEVYKVWLLAPVAVVFPVKYNVPAGTDTKSMTPLLIEEVDVPDVVELLTLKELAVVQAIPDEEVVTKTDPANPEWPSFEYVSTAEP